MFKYTFLKVNLKFKAKTISLDKNVKFMIKIKTNI